jgi:hypothetical protein
VALGHLLDSFFTDEWQRFTSGVAKLNPEQQRLALAQNHQKSLLPGETATVSIPGWDEIVHIGPRYQPTTAERAEYYQARRENRTPGISQDALTSLQYGSAVRERIRTSAQPGYSQAFGEILTAVDNVQDFFSTLSTLGRVGVWATERGLNALAPGAAVELASAAGRAAATAAAEAAALAFDANLRAGLAAGEAVAGRLLADEALRLGAQRATVAAAEKAAYQLAFRTALLGLGSRVALRLLPFVGWLLLAADLLNLLNLLGLLALPAYSLLCSGPQEALAAGVPAATFKGALKRETWKMHNLNPFSRQARAKRLAKAARGVPGFGALLEVAQTTDQLFGYGISLGGVVGVLMEGSFAAARVQRGESVRLDTTGLTSSFTDPGRATSTQFGKSMAQLGAELNQRLSSSTSQMTTADLVRLHQAARVMATAPAVLQVQETFDDETHLHTMIAYAAALSTLAPIMRGTGWQDVWADLGTVPVPIVGQPSDDSRAWAADAGVDLDASRGWWFDGNAKVTTAERYALHFAETIPRATRAFLEPRRNTANGALYGALVNEITEALWNFLEEEDDFLKWELSTDARLISSLTEGGRLVNVAVGELALWRMWEDARSVLEKNYATSLTTEMWDMIAKRNGVPLIKLLPPGSPWPQEWYDWMLAQPGATRKEVGFADDLPSRPS